MSNSPLRDDDDHGDRQKHQRSESLSPKANTVTEPIQFLGTALKFESGGTATLGTRDLASLDFNAAEPVAAVLADRLEGPHAIEPVRHDRALRGVSQSGKGRTRPPSSTQANVEVAAKATPDRSPADARPDSMIVTSYSCSIFTRLPPTTVVRT